MQLRVMFDGTADATWNMAVDEALLATGDEATLRFYGWSPHAVSLGWFQSYGDFADLPPELAVVRRLTGGGAIHHGDEITFAVTCDAAVLPGDIAASYRLLHDAVVAVLQAHGVPCARLDHGAHLAARIANALDLIPVPGVLSPAERALATKLQMSRYRDPAFLRRR
jgi:lipoate-protein ligase A